MAMKTHQVEVQKFKSASNSSHGSVSFRVDALISPRRPDEDDVDPATVVHTACC